MENRLTYAFRKKFPGTPVISKTELTDFLQKMGHSITPATINWRIHQLKKSDILKPIARGKYRISENKEFKIAPEEFEQFITDLILERYSDISFSIWRTGRLNEFSKHQAFRFFAVIEVEKDLEESVFYFLKDKFKGEVFFNPTYKEMTYYAGECDNPIIIKRQISRAPLTKIERLQRTYFVPSLEKIIVDLFADKNIYFIYQGIELVYIYDSIFRLYPVNFTTLFSYAKRRHCSDDLKTFLLQNSITEIPEDLVK